MKKNLKKASQVRNRGITLIALIVTIVVLLILAGISIGTLTGENGIIKMAREAKRGTEISEETEMVDLATIQAMKKDRYGDITKTNLENVLKDMSGAGKVEITEVVEENVLLVKFIESGRIYEVDKEGNVTYLGEETELLGKAEIGANPESNITPKLIQQVEVTVKTAISIEDENITLVYAWNQSESEGPDSSKYVKATTSKTGRTRKAIINSSDTVEGDYYLWTKVIIGEKEIVKCFGPYSIKDHTTLVASTEEKESTSGFLGNTNIARNLIQKVTIATSMEGHSLSDENCWDVSQSQDGKYIAWYEKNEAGYYEVTIAGEGGVVANSDTRYLFANIGYGMETTVEINGLENLDIGLSQNAENMFLNCYASQIEVNSFETSNVISMRDMFYGCTNLTSLNVGNFDTSKVTNMVHMFRGCKKITSLNLKNFNTINVTDMSYMFLD